MTRDKGGFKESLSCDLPFANAGGGVDTPGNLARWDVFIACNLCGDPFAVIEIDPNHLFEVAVVFSNPLSDELGLERGRGGRKGFRG